MATITDYGVYFSLSGLTVRIPVNPNEFTITYPVTNNTYNVLDIGDIIVPREPGLRVISWEGVLPADDQETFVLTSGGFKEPSYYQDLFRGYMENQSKPRLIINRFDENGTLFDTNIQVVITNFDAIERGGEVGDIYYNITCTEYRNYSAEQVSIVTAPASNTATVATTPQRQVDDGVLKVGDEVIANGTYYYTSYGDSPTGSRSNLRTTITRIVSSPKAGQNYPYHIGHTTNGQQFIFGWLQKSQLRKVT